MTDYDRTTRKQANEITLLQNELLAKNAEIELLKSQLEKAGTKLENVYVVDSEYSISKLPPPDIDLLAMRIKRAIRPFFSENIVQVISAIVDNEKANM
jgi:hypothetical protein